MSRLSTIVPPLAVAAALAAVGVASYLEGKTLWAAYNAVGVVLALAVAATLVRLRLELPRTAAAICYVTAMLHYIGGSLGGHFGIRGINGLYAVFPWWDRITHFAGATGVALLLFFSLRSMARSRSLAVPAAPMAVFAFALTVVVGVGVELFEFGAWTFFGTVDQGFYSNTMMDLYDDVLGAAFGAAVGLVSLEIRPHLRGARDDERPLAGRRARGEGASPKP